MQFFDMSCSPSFEVIQSICQLTENTTILHENMPRIGQQFDKTTKHSFNYAIDGYHVLTASTHVSSPEDIKKLSNVLSNTFPGLTFFTKHEHGKTCLHVPGINLPQNSGILQKGFSSDSSPTL